MSKKLYIPTMFAILIALVVGGLWTVNYAQAGKSAPQAQQPAPGAPNRGAMLRTALRGAGQVTQVGSDQFTIQRLNGQEVNVQVNENTIYRSRDKAELSFDDLQAGRWVIVVPERDSSKDSLTARAVIFMAEDFDPANLPGGLGTVTGVGAGSFTLETFQGQERTYTVDENTRFMGSLSSLDDLQEGMQAFVKAEETSGGELLAKVVGARPEGQGRPGQGNNGGGIGQGRGDLERHNGRITDVDESAGEFTINLRFSNKEMTFAVDENTRFRGKDDSVQSLADLEVGMVAVVVTNKGPDGQTLTALMVGAVSPDQLPKFDKRIGGQVTEVGDDSFTIQGRDGKGYTFAVSADTRFRSRNKNFTGLDDLKEGMRVIVGAQDLGSGQYQALLVLAGAAAR